MHSAQHLKQGQFNIREEYDNIINQTIEMTKHMSFEQRFEKAKSHIMDALLNRDARNTASSSQLTTLYHTLYELQSSAVWSWLVFLLSYAYIYLVILDNQSYALKIILEGSFLIIFLFDTFVDFYCKSFDKLKQKNRYPAFYFWKATLVVLLIVDLIIFISLPCYNSRPIRPFRILRGFLPVVFDQELRKCLRALASACKDIFVFVIYYTIIIVSFAFLGSQVINYDPSYLDPKFPNHPGGFDVYQSNYNDFGKMIMQIYTLGTYDNYPDNQTPALQYDEANFVFFIVFIFLNMFLFVLVPGTIIYNKFRENRSKYILVEEIRQQHSLILAFVSLTQDQHNLSMEVLIKFLFFFYRRKVRFVEYITEICLKLDDNNNQTIQVNEFMQLSKLILYNTILYPPSFDDIQAWISFRKMMNNTFRIKQIVNHRFFQVIVAFYTVLCCINTLLLLYTEHNVTKIIDYCFIWLFVLQILLKIIGNGPQLFFSDRWNALDAFLIGVNVIFFFVTIGNNIDNLFKISRVFRVSGVIKLILQSKYVSNKKIYIIEELKRLFTTIIEIMPIIVKFFLLYAFLYYIFGILGMEIFYDSEFITDDSAYNKYMQFSNFKTFIYSQYLLMQVLTQASWSTIAFDYCWKNQDYYAGIIILFIFMHFVLVTVVGTLLKGIFWEIYFTVNHSIDEINDKISSQILKEEENQIKTIEINQINEQLDQSESIAPNTVIKRQIIEKKLDQQILRRIKNFEFDSGQEEGSLSDRSRRSLSRSKIAEQIMQNWKISAKELETPFKKRRKNSITSPKFISPKIKKKRGFEFRDLESKEEHDFQQQIEELLNKLILSNKIKYSEIIAYPKMLVQYLNFKFKNPEEYINADKFDLNLNPLYNQESINFHVYELHSILGIQSSMKQKKQMILEILTKNNIVTERQGDKIFNKKMVMKKFHIDTLGALRRMYLSETNQDLVRKLEVEYFSDVYGNSFKQINKVTLEPLVKVQASLTYILWNILSYADIDSDDFFHFITHIEDQMSNKLLKKGSLVKFVYKINHQSDIWFQVEHKLHQDTQIRFIKTGVWVYTQEMNDNKIYYARDIFNWDKDQQRSENSQFGEQYMKLLYESFETLGFSLIDKESFFESNAKQHIYDLYLENFNIESAHRRSCSNNLRISKIMMIILSKQEERRDIGQKNLPYNVSQIKTMRRKVKKQDFILDQTDKETFQKLKNLSAMNHQKIIESEGLPFSYIFNLMKQIEDILKLYGNNFVLHVEKALNSKYNSIDNTSLNDDEDVISLPEIVVNIDV